MSKEYLSQARYLDARINTKIKQLEALNTLATSATSVLTGMPHSPNKATSKMADIVDKIVDLQAEINRDIDALVDLKGEMRSKLEMVPAEDYKAILEMRYLCWEIHSKAKDILEGRKFDPTFYPVVYGINDDDDWADEANWYKANPSLDVTVDVEKLRAAYNSAKDNPAEENLFRQLRLNQWVKQSVRWMPMDAWDKCDAPVDPDALRGRECYAGLDLSSSTDITAFVLVFPPDDPEGRYTILPYFWVPEDTLELRVRRDHVPYDVWKKQGSILTTEGNVIHYNFIESFIEELGQKYNIKEIAYDRWGAVQMSQNLDDDGFTIVPFGQGFKDMSPPSKEFMKLVLEGRIAHGGNAPLRWMVDNIFIRTDPAGNIKPDKEKSTERIDGAVATIMALDRAIRHQSTGSSVYDQRGLLFI